MPAFHLRILRPVVAALVAAASFAATPALAGLVSFDYTGQAADGSTVQGTFGWETSASSSPTLIGLGGVVLARRYDGAGFLTGQVSGGVLDGRSITASGLTWNVQDLDPACADCSGDALHIIYSGMFVSFFDDTKTALSSMDLPTSLDLSDWGYEHRVRLIDVQQGVGALEDFTILSIQRTAVTSGQRLPEPGSLALLSLAGACAVAVRRRAGP